MPVRGQVLPINPSEDFENAGIARRIFDIRSGLLVADHLNAGKPWRVGLKRFRTALAADGLWLRAEPEIFESGDTSSDMVLFDATAEKKAQTSVFTKLELLPEYRADIQLLTPPEGGTSQ